MKKVSPSGEEEKETTKGHQKFLEDLDDRSPSNENSDKSSNDEKKDKDRRDLETQASKKNYPSDHTKEPHRKRCFTSTWVQYADGGLGYTYGGADPLNYEPTTKNRFIRRMFTIVFIMLMITSIFNFVSAKMELKYFFQEQGSLFLVLPVAFVVLCVILMMAISECTRSPPFTYVCLLLVLIGMSIVGGFVSGRYDTLLLTYAYITTAFVTIAFIIIANTSYDFTHWSLHVIGVTIALPIILAFFLIAYFRVIEHVRPAYPTYILLIMIVGTLINVVIMTGMLQFILGSQAVEILEDHYILGAFFLYTSIYDIYIKIVEFTINYIKGEEE